MKYNSSALIFQGIYALLTSQDGGFSMDSALHTDKDTEAIFWGKAPDRFLRTFYWELKKAKAGAYAGARRFHTFFDGNPTGHAL